ncbi:MAG: hypothetical protein IPM92_11175 [Saprospiraceae bacterium]|nr:hypothetical protein [Saprospiraceae bacterium]
MKGSFKTKLSALKAIQNRFDAKSAGTSLNLLLDLQKEPLPVPNLLLEYHQQLLFIIGYPASQQHSQICEQELLRISQYLKKQPKVASKLENSGLPHTHIVSNFAHKLVKWLINEDFFVELESYKKKSSDLVKLLQLTLPDLEKDLADISETNEELIENLCLKPKQILEFLIYEFQRLEHHAILKDFLFDPLGLKFRIHLKEDSHSVSFNKLPVDKYYFHGDLLRDLNLKSLITEALPNAEFLSLEMKALIPKVSKLKLIFLQRETEPVTYMDTESIRYYVLDRGVSIAVFTMTPDRQLPLESYVGYTLFKNGYPAAYGGAWIFGKRALFGTNVFEWFRGGESAYFLGQLLRLYHQLFGVEYFEVEPYQFGLNNDEGLDSGAFWFYYRNGFKPEEAALAKLAAAEYAKLQKSKSYKCNVTMLRKLTGSNLVLNLGKGTPTAIWEIRDKVTAHINKHYEGNRFRAERACIQAFLLKTGFRKPTEPEFRKVLADVSLIFEAMSWNSTEKIFHLKEMILKKPKDLYRYQDELLKLLS